MRLTPRVLLSLLVTSTLAAQQSTQTTPSDRAAKMREHYSLAFAVHAAVIRGDLPAVGKTANDLLERFTVSPIGPAQSAAAAAIRAAAQKTTAAKDLASAATATASILKSCGDCHLAASVMPAAPSLPPAPTVGGIVGHMLEHQRADEQMLQGLVVPSTRLWRDGALAFAHAPLHEKELPANTTGRRQMVQVELRLQRIAAEAVDVTDPSARAVSYGSILAACADCHKNHAKVWGPGRGSTVRPGARRQDLPSSPIRSRPHRAR